LGGFFLNFFKHTDSLKKTNTSIPNSVDTATVLTMKGRILSVSCTIYD